MTTPIPYTIDPRPDTGVNNVMLGTWLFLASEVMLFGGLFSAYVLLRAGADIWPRGFEVLEIRLGALNTAVLMAATAVMVVARRRSAAGDLTRARVLLGACAALGLIFIGLKNVEYSSKLAHGYYASSSTFFALYYLLTAVHAVHIAGGLVVNAYLAVAGLQSTSGNAAMYANRIRAVALYWYFVDLVWLCIFVLLYLV